MKKKILIILFLVAVIGFNNFWWFAKYIDSSLSIDTEMGNHFYTRRSLEDLKRICLEIDSNTSKDELKEIIQKLPLYAFLWLCDESSLCRWE
jgi:hypothetical protein